MKVDKCFIVGVRIRRKVKGDSAQESDVAVVWVQTRVAGYGVISKLMDLDEYVLMRFLSLMWWVKV